MKLCSFCGRQAADYANFCPRCGRPFTLRTVPQKPALGHHDRMAIAGFVLSLMGLFSFITTPLQIVSLILSLACGDAKRCKVLRVLGIVFSCVALFLSCCFWIVFFSDPQYFLDQILYPEYIY